MRTNAGVAALIIAVGVSVACAVRADDAGQGQASAPASPVGPAKSLLAPGSVELSAGVDYSVGRYGASADTTVVDFPLDLKAQLGRLRLEGVLPYDYVKGPGELVGGVVLPTISTTTTGRWGLGDLTLSAAYLVAKENGLLPAVEFSGGVKLPTAKAGIGTGQTDYSAGVNLYKSVAPRVMLFASVGYSWLGSMPNYALQDGVAASGGVNFKPTPNQNLGISIAYREPIARGLDAQAAVSPYLTQRFGKHWGLTLYGTGGLTDYSPRYGGGVRLSILN